MITHFSIPQFYAIIRIGTRKETTDKTYETMVEFGESILGKGIVHAKDTPNFIGNRIGVYGMMLAINLAQEYGLTVEEVDKLTGPISGRPKARPSELDVVGLDTLKNVSLTTYDKAQGMKSAKYFRFQPF